MTSPKPKPVCTPRAFYAELAIETGSGERKFLDVIERWQRADFDAMENGLRAVVGLPADPSLPTYQRIYLERGRGHSKTSDIAICATYTLLACPTAFNGIIAAADQDQARLLLEAVRRLVRANPKLATQVKDPIDGRNKPLIEVQANKIRNTLTGSVIDAVTSDAATAFGHLASLVLMDEFTVWKKRDLFDTLISTIAKRKNCLAVIICNAPYVNSWQWPIRESIRTFPSWYFSRLDGPQASWITADLLEEQRRLLPPMAYRRLWLNEPVEGEGDALTLDVIEASFRAGVPILDGSEPGWAYVGALDLSVSRDWSAFVVIGRNSNGRYRVARYWQWRPLPGQKISQEDIRSCIQDATRKFNLRRIVTDPFQAEATVEILQRDGIPIHTRPQNGAALMEQAMHLVEVFNTFCIDIPPDEVLRQQLISTRVEQRSYGLRLVLSRSADGSHSDLLSALSIGLPAAKDVKPLGSGVWGGQIGQRGPVLGVVKLPSFQNY